MIKQYFEKWKLCGYNNYTPVIKRTMETGVELHGVIDEIDAEVPGGVHDALLANHLIDDPYFELNSIQCEWVENRFWIYHTTFSFGKKQGKYRIVFEGLDYKCDILFNNQLVGRHENMYTPCVIDVTEQLIEDCENEIKVMFYNAPNEMGQIGYTSAVSTQKARFSYKWDYCPRLVGVGIYKPVYFEQYKVDIQDYYFNTAFDDLGKFNLSFDVVAFSEKELTARLTVSYANNEVVKLEESVNGSSGSSRVNLAGKVENPHLWYCSNEGEQSLYDTVLELVCDGEVILTREALVGFKALKFLPNELAAKNAMPYLFQLNGANVYVRGFDISPIDMLYGRITNERYRDLIVSAKEANANMIRIWGGGLIESEYFYELCDQYGIMVWQDFIQSSSGLDNHPSDENNFIENFMQTVRFAVQEKRNHVSTSVFCGGNEIAFGKERKPIDENCKLIKLVGDYVRNNCHVHFVPSTPQGPYFEHDMVNLENNHNIHGPWLYMGDPEQYEYCNLIQCLFRCEFGCNGMTQLSSLKKFLSEKNIGKFNMSDNVVWRHHGDVWDTSFRDQAIFGEEIRSLDDAIYASQYIQAEGLKYIIESDRTRAFQSGGVSIWQLNELFPNVSGTNLIDYYGFKKPAYYQVKKCYHPLYISVKYTQLLYTPTETCKIKPYIIFNMQKSVDYTITITCDGELVRTLSGKASGEKDRTTFLDEIEFVVPYAHGIMIQCEVVSALEKFENTVVLLVKNDSGKASLEPARAYVAYLLRS